MRAFIESAAAYIIPAVLLICALMIIKLRGRGGEAFISGARSGLDTAVSLIPTMVMLTVGLTMFCASGAIEILTSILSPICRPLGIIPEILPLVVTRPISGSASTAAYAQLLSQYGADSAAAVSAGIIMGSSDTLVYVISVYFSAARGVRSTRHAFPVAAVVSVLCVLLSCFLYKVFFVF